MAFVFLMFAVIVASAVACHYIAKSRDANFVFWGLMGALFGPFAIPFAFFSKPVQR